MVSVFLSFSHSVPDTHYFVLVIIMAVLIVIGIIVNGCIEEAEE